VNKREIKTVYIKEKGQITKTKTMLLTRQQKSRIEKDAILFGIVPLQPSTK
jgi:hypothetical protein